MKRLLMMASVILLWAQAALGASFWGQRANDIYLTPKTTWAAMDAFITPTGFYQVGPGSEGLTPAAYRPGVCILWARYDAYRFLGTPLEVWPTGKRAMRVDSSGVYADSGLITPRLGPRSTATTGGAIRIVDGVTFPLTVAGVQAALDEVEVAGGGQVYVPASAGILVSTIGLKLGNRVGLFGLGNLGINPTFDCTATCNVGAIIENKTIDGTQQQVQIGNIYVRGNQGASATDSVGIRLRGLFIGTALRDIRITNIKGRGIVCDDPSNNGLGPIYFENTLIANVDGDGFVYGNDNGGGIPGQPWIIGLDIERWGTGKAALRIQTENTSGSAAIGGFVKGLYTESANDATASIVVIKNWAGLTLEDFSNGAGVVNYPVKLEGTFATTGIFGNYGVTVRNVFANNDTILFDQTNNFAITNANGGHLYEYRTKSKSPSIMPLIVASDSARANLGLYVGGRFIPKIDGNSASLNFGAPGAVPGSVDLTITVNGAALGNRVAIGSSIAVGANYILTGFVSAANTVTIRWTQIAGAAADPDGAGATYSADILQ